MKNNVLDLLPFLQFQTVSGYCRKVQFNSYNTFCYNLYLRYRRLYFIRLFPSRRNQRTKNPFRKNTWIRFCYRIYAFIICTLINWILFFQNFKRTFGCFFSNLFCFFLTMFYSFCNGRQARVSKKYYCL